MGMGQELRDFTQGFRTGFSLRDRSKALAQRNLERSGMRSQADLDAQNKIINERGAGGTGGPGNPRAPSTSDPTGSAGSYGTPGVDDPDAARLLGFIRQKEAGGEDPYNRVLGGHEPDLTKMTIDQVYDYQKGMINSKKESSAVGAYQIVNGTLRDQVAKLGLNPATTLYNQQTQDALGFQLLKNHGFDAWKANPAANTDKFMHSLSQEWASLPKDASGRSFYEGVGSNHAGATWDQFKSVLGGSGGSPDATASARTAIPQDQAVQQGKDALAAADAGHPADTNTLAPTIPPDTTPVPPVSTTSYDASDPNNVYGDTAYTNEDGQNYASGGPVAPTNANEQGSGRVFTQPVAQAIPSPGMGTTSTIPSSGWVPRQISAPPPNSAIVNPAAGAQQKFRDNLAASQQAIAARNAAKPAPEATGPFSHQAYIEAQNQYMQQNPQQPANLTPPNRFRDNTQPVQPSPFMDEATWQSRQPGYADWYQQTYGKAPPTGLADGGFAEGVASGLSAGFHSRDRAKGRTSRDNSDDVGAGSYNRGNVPSSDDSGSYNRGYTSDDTIGYARGGQVMNYAEGGQPQDDPTGYDQANSTMGGGGPAPGYEPNNYDYTGQSYKVSDLKEMDDAEMKRRRSAAGTSTQPARNPSRSAIPTPKGDPSEEHSNAGNLPTPDDAGYRAIPDKPTGPKANAAMQKAAHERLVQRDKDYNEIGPLKTEGYQDPNLAAAAKATVQVEDPGKTPGGTPTPPAQQGPPIPSPGSEPGGTPSPAPQQGPPVPNPGAEPGGTPMPQGPQGPPAPPQQGPPIPPAGQPVDYSTTPTNQPPIPPAPVSGPPIPPHAAPPQATAIPVPVSQPGSVDDYGQPNTYVPPQQGPPIPPKPTDPALLPGGVDDYGRRTAIPPEQQGPPIPQKPTPATLLPGGVDEYGRPTAPAPQQGPPIPPKPDASAAVTPPPIVKPGKVHGSRPAIVKPAEVQESTKAALGSLNKGFGAKKQYVAIGPDQQANSEVQANTAKFLTNADAMPAQQFNQIAQQVDPDHKLSDGERVMKMQQDLYDFYMAKGYPDKAAGAAASVLMYGRRLSQISGSMAQAALEKGDTNTAAAWMAKAYTTMPDGKELRIGKADASGNVQYQLVDLHSGEAGEVMSASPDDMLTMAKQMASGAEWAKQTIGIAQGTGVGVNAGSQSIGGRGRRYGGSSGPTYSQQTAEQKQGLAQAIKAAGDAYKKSPTPENKQAFEDAASAALAGQVSPGAVTAFRKQYGLDTKTGGTAKERQQSKDDQNLQQREEGVNDPAKQGVIQADDAFNRAARSNRFINTSKIAGALEGLNLDDATKGTVNNLAKQWMRANPFDATQAVEVIAAAMDPAVPVTIADGKVKVGDKGSYIFNEDMLRQIAALRKARRPQAQAG